MGDKGRGESRRLESMVSVRFSPQEEERVREAAERSKQSVSGYVRRAALQAAGVLEYRPSSRTSTSASNGALSYKDGRFIRTGGAEPQVTFGPGPTSTT